MKTMTSSGLLLGLLNNSHQGSRSSYLKASVEDINLTSELFWTSEAWRKKEGRGKLILPSIVADLIYGTTGQRTTIVKGTSLDLGDTLVKGSLYRFVK